MSEETQPQTTIDMNEVGEAPSGDTGPLSALTMPSVTDLVTEDAANDALEARERSLIDKLAGMQRAKEIFQMRADLLTTARRVAISETNPSDWVASKPRDGEPTVYPTAPACDKMAELYGIQVCNIRPTDSRGAFDPDYVKDKGSDNYTVRGWCDAFSLTTGRRIENLECSRHSKEQFLGRGTESDMRSCVITLMRTKATRILTGTARFPHDTFCDIMKKAGKNPDHVTRGHGFGSGTERRAQSAADEDIKPLVAAFAKDIMQRVGGDTSAAKQLCKEVTKGKDFDGFDSPQRMTKKWQIENATKKLKAHPTFGDARSAGGA